jgi:hypothetical protein
MEDLDVSKGVIDWDADQALANAKLKYLDVNIAGRQMTLGFSARDLRRSGANVISAKTKSIIGKFLDEVDYAIWKGNIQEQSTLSTGVIAQATQDAAGAGTYTAAQASAAIIYVNAKYMYTAIPAKYRSRFPVVLFMDWKSYENLGSGVMTGFTISAKEVFQKAFPNCTIVPTNTILASGDVEGTNGRMLSICQNQDLCRLIMAKAAAPAGPAMVDLTGGVKQIWGTLFAPKVIQATAVRYTATQLTF